MSQLFVDTSGWGNLVDRSQPFHSLAATFYRLARQQNHAMVTTNYVIAELVALLTSPLKLPKPQIITFVQGLKQSTYVEIVHIDGETDTHAWQLLMNRKDKNWSLVDCSSFIVMQQKNITESLTNDNHFEQAGFVRLLK